MGYGIAVDSSGNAYVSGRFQTSTADFGSTTLNSSGEYDVFVAKLSTGGEPPQTGITGLTPTLMPAARVDFTWSLSDSAAANAFLDSVYIYYCSGVGCDPTDGGEKAKGQITMDSFTLIGTDGETYTVLVRAENSNGFNEDSVGTSTVTADGSVSPAPTIADFVGGGNSADDGLTFSWSATDDSDVDSWMICWAASQSVVEDDFGDLVSAYQQSGGSCAATEDTTTSLEISELMICGADCATKLYFGIAGVDEVGNVDSDSDKSDAMVAADFSAGVVAPPDIPGEDDDKSESDAPEKAMYAIIALVVLAVIGGAFILTRGGGGEGEDKEWDY
jgi:hypothetical protein